MSSQANIVVFDGAASPVSHTLVPISNTTENGEQVAEWREMNMALPIIAQPKIFARRRKLKNGIEQVSISVAVPVMEAVSNQNAAGYTAAPKVAYTNTYVFNGYFHERATPTERRLGRMLLTNIMNNVTTSVTATAAGPVAELTDQSIFVS